MKSSQRGFTLAEVAIAAAIAAIALGALLFAMGGTARFAAHQSGPTRQAALLLAEQSLRTAEDAWKYGAPGNVPAGAFATSVPLTSPRAGATGAPVRVNAAISNTGGGPAELTVTVSYTPDPGRAGDSGTVSVTGTLFPKAPLPGSQIVDPQLVAQPSPTPTPCC